MACLFTRVFKTVKYPSEEYKCYVLGGYYDKKKYIEQSAIHTYGHCYFGSFAAIYNRLISGKSSVVRCNLRYCVNLG